MKMKYDKNTVSMLSYLLDEVCKDYNKHNTEDTSEEMPKEKWDKLFNKILAAKNQDLSIIPQSDSEEERQDVKPDINAVNFAMYILEKVCHEYNVHCSEYTASKVPFEKFERILEICSNESNYPQTEIKFTDRG